MNPIDAIVGANVRKHRVLAGLSQEQLGAAVALPEGLTFQQVQKYERGLNRISASRLVELAHALGVPVMELFAGVEDEGKKIEANERSLAEIRGDKKALEAYSLLPADVQKSMCNLMEAMTIAMGATLKEVR